MSKSYLFNQRRSYSKDKKVAKIGKFVSFIISKANLKLPVFHSLKNEYIKVFKVSSAVVAIYLPSLQLNIAQNRR